MTPHRPAAVTGATWLSVAVVAMTGLTALLTLVFDDELFVLQDGEVRGRPELVGHSRGYAAYRDGVLRFAHGSRAPASS